LGDFIKDKKGDFMADTSIYWP